jgi:menaquinone-9 beta-reductase
MGLPPVEDCDVLIVGAGPAGCTAGILLARNGVRVSILEREAPDHHKICGDLLGPRSLWLLDELGLGEANWPWQGTPIHSISVFDETGMRSWARFCGTKEQTGPALTLRRDRFDRFLQEQAARAGCRIHYGIGFRSLREGEKDFAVCRAEREGKSLTVKSRVVLGADGVNSRVASAAGLRERRTGKLILAVRGYFRNVQGLRDSIELYFLRDYLPGYAWVIPLGGGVANIGLGLRADVCVRKGLHLRAELERFVQRHPGLAPRTRGAQPSGRIQGWPIGSYDRQRRRSGPHLLLLGDAASLADPLSGEGIYGAMKSAALAAEVVLEALSRGDFSGGQLSRYDNEIRRHFDGAYRFTGFLSSLPSYHRLLQPLVRWGLKRVENNCLLDPEYAAMVGGFFTGLLPRRRMWNAKWFRRTFLG